MRTKEETWLFQEPDSTQEKVSDMTRGENAHEKQQDSEHCLDHDDAATDRVSPDSVGRYLQEIGEVPLLTASEEVELGEKIIRGNAAIERMASGQAISPTLMLALQADIEEAQKARQQLICANLRLVISIARKYTGRGMQMQDLIQEGNMGLMRAVNKFDPTRGNRFSTYATHWIRQAVTRAIADQSRTIRIPVHMTESVSQLRRITETLIQEYGRQPTPEEIALVLDQPVDRIKKIFSLFRHPVSLETTVGEEEEHTLGEFIASHAVINPSDHAIQEMLRSDLKAALSRLSEREQRILAMRYGLEDGYRYTLDEIGTRMGITRERARQIELEALRRIRHSRLGRHLRDYLE